MDEKHYLKKAREIKENHWKDGEAVHTGLEDLMIEILREKLGWNKLADEIESTPAY